MGSVSKMFLEVAVVGGQKRIGLRDVSPAETPRIGDWMVGVKQAGKSHEAPDNVVKTPPHHLNHACTQRQPGTRLQALPAQSQTSTLSPHLPMPGKFSSSLIFPLNPIDQAQVGPKGSRPFHLLLSNIFYSTADPQGQTYLKIHWKKVHSFKKKNMA